MTGTMARIALVPGTGLGMAATRLSQAGRPARVTEALYCPPAVRDDPALAATVQQRLDEWAAGVGLAPGPAAGLGRLVVLAHPDTDDVGRLAVAGRLLAVGRLLAGGAFGGRQEDLLRRAPTDADSPSGSPSNSPAAAADAAAQVAAGVSAATLAQALDEAIAEVYDGCDMPDAALPSRPDPARAASTDPALASALAGLSALPSSPYQVDRVRAEYESLSAASPAAAGGGPRPAWEYLSLGHVNAYSPALAALDAVNGFEVPPSAAADPELRRAQRLAAFAAALLHDIAEPSPTGLTAAIAHTDGLGPGAAGRRAAEVHDEAMRAFMHHASQLAAGTDPATRRYLSALWTWLGGHRTWHAVT